MHLTDDASEWSRTM